MKKWWRRRKSRLKKTKWQKIILTRIMIFLAIFIVSVMVLNSFGIEIQNELIILVGTLAAGEFGFSAWIKNTDTKNDNSTPSDYNEYIEGEN